MLTCWVPLLLENGVINRAKGLLVFLALGKLCRVLGKKRNAWDARQALQDNGAPPVIYLRSFRHDGRKIQEGLWHDYSRSMFAMLTPTPEEHLARVLRRAGPLVAIGKPGEELPGLGAARMYVGHDDWQAVVHDLLNRPHAVALLQAGETQGLRWELSRIGRDLKPEQVLLFLPFGLWARGKTREKQYATFREWGEECLRAELPDQIGNSCFIYFSSEPRWQAHLLNTREEVPPKHQLWPILKALQKERAFQPKKIFLVRGVNSLFRALLFLLSIWLISFLIDVSRHEEWTRPFLTEPASQSQVAFAPPIQKAIGQVEKPVRYTGKKLPYHVTLGAEWAEVPPTRPKVDRFFKYGEQFEIGIVVQREETDVSMAAAAMAKALSESTTEANGPNKIDRVELVENRKIMLNGKEWVHGKIKTEVGGKNVWMYTRAYSGPEGAYQLIGTSETDDPERRKILMEALDSFELPSLP
jgi:hypothetical protein